jgi:uncharacterized membrane protein
MALATWFGARRSRFRRIVLAALKACEYMIGLLFAAISVEPVVHVTIWLIVFGPLVFIAQVLVAMSRAIAEPGEAVEPAPNECWKSGIIYYNPNHSALFRGEKDWVTHSILVIVGPGCWCWGLVLVVGTAPLLM